MASDAPVSWNRQYQARPISARLDSAAGIRGLPYDGVFIDEVAPYSNSVYNITYPPARGTFNTYEAIDAEWTDVRTEMRVARWNTVWADIGQAYNKKVHCIEG